jgi:hypothetical protein
MLKTEKSGASFQVEPAFALGGLTMAIHQSKVRSDPK